MTTSMDDGPLPGSAPLDDPLKSQFLATISHELRTPLNAIINFAYLLRQTSLDPCQQDYTARIQRAGQTLLALIDDMLDFSHTDSGHLSIHEQPFDLGDVLNTVIGLATVRKEKKQVRLVVHVSADVPCHLSGDALRLGQVLTNLLVNAIKFTARGEVALMVDVPGDPPPEIPLSPATIPIRFTVRDTGIGIAPEQIDRLFRAFSQADHSIARRFGGTGLGLAISKRLVELMGGVIGVASVPEQGSSFHVVLPLRIASPEDTCHMTLPAGPPAGYDPAAPDAVSSHPQVHGSSYQGDAARAVCLAHDMISLLQQDVGQAMALLPALQAALPDAAVEGIFHQLKSSLDEFELDQAVLRLHQMLQALEEVPS
jgi:hypothetical protein